MKSLFEKKEYKAPKMSILDMRGKMCLLAGSEPFETDEYDDEFGFTQSNGTNRHA